MRIVKYAVTVVGVCGLSVLIVGSAAQWAYSSLRDRGWF